MTREIILDTETTGLDPDQGHRIVEIGCVELMNHVPTGRHFHAYINPERPMPSEAAAIHGLTDKFLSDKPVFSQIYSDFIAFIAEARLVIHNADFDMRFVNWELKQVGHKPLSMARVVDTVQMARSKFPGSPANLDALCRRFGVDNTGRTLHGALLDAQLLSEVYLELLGGRQHGLGLAEAKEAEIHEQGENAGKALRRYREARQFAAHPLEVAAHKKMLEKIKNALWLSDDSKN